MYAGLIFKAQTQDGVLYCVERRPMGCFNGLNNSGAFTGPSNYSSCLFTKKVGSEWLFNQLAPEQTPAWELLAIGWFTDASDLSASPQTNNVTLAVLNNNERLGSWTNPYNGEETQTKRTMTSNEIECEILIKKLQMAPERGNNSILHKIFRSNPSYNYQLFDFVGSERSSGIAVAYLQVFRNTARVVYPSLCGYAKDQYQLLNNVLVRSMISSGYRLLFKSYVPLLSSMFNYGSDSDIFSYTDNTAVFRQASKFGVFSLSEFFRNTSPMAVEGRYNKGEQSSTLASNINRRCRERNVNQNGASGEVGFLCGLGSSVKELNNVLNPASLVSNYNNADSALSSLRSALNNAYRYKNPSEYKNKFDMALAGFEDLTTPVQAQRPVAPQRPTGFTRWVSENEDVLH